MANKRVRKQRREIPAGGHSNQYLLDPRQSLCWAAWIDPKSPTFSNAYASALHAGYTDQTAKQITSEYWWSERVRRLTMLHKAERNLDELLDLPSKTQAMGAFGPLWKTKKMKVRGKNGKMKIKNVATDEPIMTHNVGLLTLKQKASEFVAERVGKKRYSLREKDPGTIYNTIIFANEQRIRIAKRVIGGGSIGSEPGQGEPH